MAGVKTILLAVLLTFAAAAHAADTPTGLDAQAAGHFAKLALSCVHREYPNKIAHVLASDADVQPPRELTPAFFGCYDWHSSVHGHWMLARLAREFPQEPWAEEARAALDRSLTPQNISAEVAYLRGAGRESFERPYGLAWLLTLAAELRSENNPRSQRWATALAPLETEAAAHLSQWLPKLRYPIREGEHDQTAFSFGMVWDWAKASGRADMLDLLRNRAQAFYANDRDCPIPYEPSGQDFLSPCLAEADFMGRVMEQSAYAKWLSAFLAGIPVTPSKTWLAPGEVTDRTDPKLAHIDGLNISRAWMLRGIARALPRGDKRITALEAAAAEHQRVSLPAVTGEHYVGGHWLGTFAVYLLAPRQ